MNSIVLPYSWGDIADALSSSRKRLKWPATLVKVEIYWDQATFLVEDLASAAAVTAMLEELFPFRVKDQTLLLDGPDFSKVLPFTFEIYDPDFAGLPPPALPSQYVAASSQIWFKESEAELPRAAGAIPTFAFHSVKGGVGRTTSAISFALNLVAEFNQRPLVVDADFEAPGISYLFHGDGREVHFSLEDLLVLSHADADPDASSTIQFAATKLANQSQDGMTILPCLRAREMLTAFAIRPEQLQRSHSGQPFFLLQILRKLAAAANCTSLVIDLRAGFTDLAAMILCAPEVAPVFVTTPSGQAIASTQQMLEFIGGEVAARPTLSRYPAIIVNNVISQVRRTSEFSATIRSLEDSATSFVQDVSETVTPDEIIDLSGDEVLGTPVVVLDHAPALTAAPPSFRYFAEDLQAQACFDQLSIGLRDWTAQYLEPAAITGSSELLEQEIAPKDAKQSPLDLGRRREKLHEFARQRIFADSLDSSTDEFLVVGALRQLAARFRTELPNATCIGMKGAGKTFTFRVLCQHRNWSSYIEKIGDGQTSQATVAEILPVLPARSLQQLPFSSQLRQEFADSFGIGKPIAFSRLNALIDQTAHNLATESVWGEFWLDSIGWSCGVDPEKRGAGRKLIQILIEQQKRIVTVFDGLEESFQAFRNDSRQQAAIRGLTSALPQILLEVPGRPIGQINFVRSDLVASAFPNNSRQFADRNRAFALTWYERDILELAAWLAKRAGVADTWDEESHENDTSTLEEKLHQLWGHKMGKADDLAKGGRTREPRSAEWVVAALSDLRGRLTARDLVGFIASSAERSIQDQSLIYRDRLLVPRAMSGAITPVGKEKINAMAEENPGLKPVIENLRQAPQFSVPLTLKEFQDKVPGVDEEALKMLQENGIILIEGDSVEMPEIFRTGLGNVVRAKGGRRSIIGLMNKARQYRSLDTAL